MEISLIAKITVIMTLPAMATISKVVVVFSTQRLLARLILVNITPDMSENLFLEVILWMGGQDATRK